MFRALRSLVICCLAICSLQQEYDPTLAFEMLRASTAAYCYDSELQNMGCGDICNDLQGYQYIEQYNYDISSSESVSFSTFVNTDANIFVMAFRGTTGFSQLVDELMHSRAVTYDLHDINDAVVTGYFYDQYKNLRDDVLSALQAAIAQYPDYTFNFAGHSLGGAFATLALLDASYGQYLPKERTNLFSYGCPRVGDFNLAQAVVNSANTIYRVTHYKDIIPHLPPCVVNWERQCQADPGHASEDGTLLFNAWHVWPEIFYTGETSLDFKICQDGEDPACSDQFLTIMESIADHLMYLGHSTRCHQSNSFLSKII